MRIAILSGGRGGHVLDLERAGRELGHETTFVDFCSLHAHAPASNPSAPASPLDDFDAVLVRNMPAGSLEQVVFRMDVLHALKSTIVLNPPRAIETCVDKYLTNVRLLQAGLPVPPTAVSQKAEEAMRHFAELDGDVVVKPLFGAEGRGMVRVTDIDIADRVFAAIERISGVIYQQKFIPHPDGDIRAFVIGGKVRAAMRRRAKDDWRTNIARGGYAEPLVLSDRDEALAIRAAAAVGVVIAGVDLLPGPDGKTYILEVNASPGWKTLAPTCGIDIAREIVRFLTEEYRP